MKKTRELITIFLYLPIVFLFMIGPTNIRTVKTNQQVKDTLRYRTNPNYQLQSTMFDIYKTRQADIIMFGNSLTHGAAWNELLGRSNVAERGITGDVLYGYESRLGSILRMNPKIVFIMGGLNDVYNWTPVEEIFSVYVRVISKLKTKNIIPVIQSTTYSAKAYGKDWGVTPERNFGRNREIDKLNKLISDYARNNNIDFIDLNSLTADRDGFLKPELTWDGIHFKAEAYRIWAREVEKVLAKYKF